MSNSIGDMRQKKWIQRGTVAQEKIEAIIEAIRMSPTSSGTQPFELIVVTNKNIREEICKGCK
jgi:nitroreductase